MVPGETSVHRFLSLKPSANDLARLVSRVCVLIDETIGTKSAIADTVRQELVTAFRQGFDTKIHLLFPSGHGSGTPDIRDEAVQVELGRCLGLMILGFPEYVLPLGFDEVRYGAQPVVSQNVSESVKGTIKEGISEGTKRFESGRPPALVQLEATVSQMLFEGTQFRRPGGTWHDFEAVADVLVPQSKGAWQQDQRPFIDWWEGLRSSWISTLESSDGETGCIVTFPNLILPRPNDDTLLHATTRRLLRQLAVGKRRLGEIHWHELEELVAELLRDLGLKVDVTPKTHDGGRDVIARGELIPGEPTVLAVEVKHMAVVPVASVRQALWANRQFPALLFATSGRFGAGVYRERYHEASRLRLFLKDGAALAQWIDQYAEQHGYKGR